MWIAKGVLLGVWLFSFGTILSFYFTHRGTGPGMFGIEALLPISNPSFWLWLIACLSLSMIAARNWPGRGVLGSIVWAGLAVTEPFPVAILAFILVVVGKMKQQTP
jgi:hypothetical protein